MKKGKITLALVFITTFFACNEATEQVTMQPESESSTTIVEPTAEEIKAKNEELVVEIDNKRKEIEDNLGEPIVIQTSELRAKIKQKWEKIHFYSTNNEVVRIKTYPYPKISERTEEFYLKDGKLILAVIEDNGAGDRGKSIEEIDKLYYFNDGELIKEVRKGKEEEYSVNGSDAQQLLSEAKEYLAIYSKNTAK